MCLPSLDRPVDVKGRGDLSSWSAKVVIIGNAFVGKTTLLNRFTSNRFDHQYKATMGVDFEECRFAVCGYPFRLHLWDTAGQVCATSPAECAGADVRAVAVQERFKALSAMFFRGANVMVAVFDLSNPSTLKGAIEWIQQTEENNKGSPGLCRFLVGSKLDLLDESTAMGQVCQSALGQCDQLNRRVAHSEHDC
jgi:small GTP-binding protein